MNILLLTDKLATGGAEMYFCKLENSLTHPDLTFYTAAGSGELFSQIVNKERFSEISRKNHFYNLMKIYRVIKRNKINLVHANSLRMVLYCIFLKKLTFIKFNLVYTKHNITVLEGNIPKLFSKLLNNHADSIITVSDFEKDNLISLGVKKELITTIYNGVDLNQFQFHKKDTDLQFKIGILARLSEEKNHELFLKIAHELKEHQNLMFYVAGDGPEAKNIKKMIQNLNIDHKVKLLGAVSEPEKFIKSMDLLLLTSYREVFPMTIIEAMAVGTPIISIDRGGIREAIKDNQTGILIKEHSVYDFCTKINYIKANPKLKNNIIEVARKKAEKEFSLHYMVEGTLKEYLKHTPEKIS
ncbi:glycosyltransferase [Bacillus sp. HMSC76G11]|nr:glycosyltransferase [Bacillus sp. HMSC76G11]